MKTLYYQLSHYDSSELKLQQHSILKFQSFSRNSSTITNIFTKSRYILTQFFKHCRILKEKLRQQYTQKISIKLMSVQIFFLKKNRQYKNFVKSQIKKKIFFSFQVFKKLVNIKEGEPNLCYTFTKYYTSIPERNIYYF